MIENESLKFFLQLTPWVQALAILAMFAVVAVLARLCGSLFARRG